MLKSIHVTGIKGGKHLLVLGAVHGNETAGTKAMERLIPLLQSDQISLDAGELTLVPVCNLKAYQQGVRQIDENLNRVIKEHENPKTYEQSVANEIVKLIQQADIVLDLHSSHCPGDIPFVFCDYPTEENKKLVAGLPVAYVLEGWPDIYKNNPVIQNFSTEWFAHTCGKSAVTLECGYHQSPDAADVAYQAIMQVLRVYGLISQKPLLPVTQKHILLKSYVIQEAPGHLVRNYRHLDPVVKGQPIAMYEDGRILTAPQDGYILLPNPKEAIGAEWYYFGEAV